MERYENWVTSVTWMGSDEWRSTENDCEGIDMAVFWTENTDLNTYQWKRESSVDSASRYGPVRKERRENPCSYWNSPVFLALKGITILYQLGKSIAMTPPNARTASVRKRVSSRCQNENSEHSSEAFLHSWNDCHTSYPIVQTKLISVNQYDKQ